MWYETTLGSDRYVKFGAVLGVWLLLIGRLLPQSRCTTFFGNACPMQLEELDSWRPAGIVFSRNVPGMGGCKRSDWGVADLQNLRPEKTPYSNAGFLTANEEDLILGVSPGRAARPAGPEAYHCRHALL